MVFPALFLGIVATLSLLSLSLQSYRFHLSSTYDPFLSWPQQLYRAMFGIPVHARQDSFNEFGTTMYA